MENFDQQGRTFAIEKNPYFLPLKSNLSKFALAAILLCLFGLKAMAQHPIGYQSIKATSQVATFEFDSLDRAVLKQKAASFFSPEPIALTFDVLVAANGDVKYVRAPHIKSEFAELRLACTSALYAHAFEPVDATWGERWFKAKMVLENN